MKATLHVLSAADHGDVLTVEGQGKADAAGEFASLVHLQIKLPMNEKAKKAFFVGRKFDIEVTPR